MKARVASDLVSADDPLVPHKLFDRVDKRRQTLLLQASPGQKLPHAARQMTRARRFHTGRWNGPKQDRAHPARHSEFNREEAYSLPPPVVCGLRGRLVSISRNFSRLAPVLASSLSFLETLP